MINFLRAASVQFGLRSTARHRVAVNFDPINRDISLCAVARAGHHIGKSDLVDLTQVQVVVPKPLSWLCASFRDRVWIQGAPASNVNEVDFADAHIRRDWLR